MPDLFYHIETKLTECGSFGRMKRVMVPIENSLPIRPYFREGDLI